VWARECDGAAKVAARVGDERQAVLRVNDEPVVGPALADFGGPPRRLLGARRIAGDHERVRTVRGDPRAAPPVSDARGDRLGLGADGPDARRVVQRHERLAQVEAEIHALGHARRCLGQAFQHGERLLEVRRRSAERRARQGAASGPLEAVGGFLPGAHAAMVEREV